MCIRDRYIIVLQKLKGWSACHDRVCVFMKNQLDMDENNPWAMKQLTTVLISYHNNIDIQLKLILGNMDHYDYGHYQDWQYHFHNQYL